jgi:hypothetical protein
MMLGRTQNLHAGESYRDLRAPDPGSTHFMRAGKPPNSELERAVTFGLDPKHVRDLWAIMLGIPIAQYLQRAMILRWRTWASAAVSADKQPAPRSADYGEIRWTAIVVIVIAIIWIHVAPDVSNIPCPNQWP